MSEIIIYQDWIEAKQYLEQSFRKHYKPEQIMWIDCDQVTDINILLSQQQMFCQPIVYVLTNANFLNNANLFQKHKHVLTTINTLDKEFKYFLLTNKKPLANQDIKTLLSDFKITELKITTIKQKQKLIDQILALNNTQLPLAVYEQIVKCTDFTYGNIYHEVLKAINLLQTNCDLKDVLTCVSNYNDENVFNLLEAIVLKQFKTVWAIYTDLMNRQVDELVIMPALSTQAINVYYCLTLNKKGMQAAEIAQKIGINVYFLMQHINKFKHLDFNIFKEIVLILYNLEIDIKLAKVDKALAFKQCLLTLIKI